MSTQDLFYSLASIFFVLAIFTVIFFAVLFIKIYSKVTKIVDAVESKVLTSNKYLQKLQLGALGTLLGFIKSFR